MTNIGLIVALKAEVPDMFRDSKVHHLADSSIKVVISGMGPRKARKAAEKLIAFFGDQKPDYIINLGFCGATGREPGIGDLILADRVSDKKSEILLDENYILMAKEVLGGTGYFTGKIESFHVPVFSGSKVSKDTLAVDMEAYTIVETALQYQVPVLVVKAVSDIVPQKFSLTGLWRTVKEFKYNSKQAKHQLDMFVGSYF